MTNDPMVFVVDDDAAVLASTAAVLRASDLNVATFASAEAFLAAYERNQTGCLLLDIRLPGMSGLELHEKLKMDGVALSVVLISGHADGEVRRLGEVGGAFAVLEKPIESHRLIEWVRTAVTYA